ncbi:MAG: tetratricopeptide repeat protein [Phycisphaerales bacterium]
MATQPHRRRLIALAIVLGALTPALTAVAAPEHDERAYYTANGLLNRGLYDLAADEYRRFLESNADHEKAPLAHYGLGVALYRLGQHAEALEQLDMVAGDEAFEFAAETDLLRGHCHLALNAPEEAARDFASVVREHADHASAPDAAVLLVESLNRAGRHDEAVQAADAVAKRWPDAPMRDRAELFKGLSLLATDHPTEAADAFEGIVRRSPDGELANNAQLLLAQSRHRLGAQDDAEQAYRRVIDRAPPELAAEAMVGLGQLERQRGRFKEAAKTLDDALTRYPDSPMAPRASLERARVSLETNDLDAATKTLDRLASEGPKDLRDDATYWRAKVDLRRGDAERAAARLEQAASDYPESELRPEMVYDRAIALSRAERREEAADTIKSFLKAYPKHRLTPDALHAAASIAHARGLYDDSLAMCALFEASFADNPLAPEVEMLRAENEYMRGNLKPAEGAYRAVLASNIPESLSTRASYRLGMTLYRDGRFGEAEPMLLKAADLAESDPSYARSLVALGDGYFEQGDWKKSEGMFSRVVSLNAESTPIDDALLKLGLSLERQGEYERAVAVFRRLLVEHPGSDRRLHAEFELAQSLVALERYGEAEPHLQAVLDSEDNERFAAHAMNHMGAVARARGDHAAAADWFRRAAEAGGDDLGARAMYDQAESLLVAGNAQAAVERFTQFLDEHPDHELAARAGARRAVALSRADRPEEALKEIEAIERGPMSALPERIRHAVMYEKAWSLRAVKRPEDAAVAYRDLLAQPVDTTLRAYALLDLGGIELDAEHWDKASEALGELVTLLESEQGDWDDDVRAQGAYRLAAASLRLGDNERAVELLDGFSDRYPSSDLVPAAGIACGEAQSNLGRHEKAADEYARVARDHEDSEYAPTALLRLGDEMVALQRWEDAERAFGRFLESHADDERWFQARFGMGWAKEQDAKQADAIEDYRRVVDRHQGPTAARAQFQIGECLYAMGRLDEAVTELLRVDILYAYDEWSAAALYEAGRCLEQLQRPNKAREQYEQVVQRFPNERWAPMAQDRLKQIRTTPPPGQGP